MTYEQLQTEIKLLVTLNGICALTPDELRQLIQMLREKTARLEADRLMSRLTDRQVQH